MQQADQWNASSPVRQDAWVDFQKQRRVVFDQLAYLRAALYLLREVATFPLDKLVPDTERIFFTVTARALYETAVLAITKLTTDEGDNVLTVNRFRNNVLKMLRPDLVDSFRDQLKNTKFDAAMKDVAKRAKDLRNARLAHLSLGEVLNASTPLVAGKELEQLADELEKLYEPLLFGATASFLPVPYDPEIRAANARQDTDIEKILNAVARESYALNFPEKNTRVWEQKRGSMTDEEVETFNFWRARAGLPPA
jgi:hypothetical protein